MSWWISLEDAGPVANRQDGGTQVLGGSDEASLNVTYNYSAVTNLVGFHFRDSLAGKRAGDTIEALTDVVNRLGTRQHEDYWAPTPGNAGYAASILLEWAKQYPNAIWRVH